MKSKPESFNRASFITLNKTRLFTAEQVADLIEQHSNTPEREIREQTLKDVWTLLEKNRQIDGNDQYYLWMEDIECMLNSLRTPTPEAHR